MVSGITPCARECKWIVYFGETPYRLDLLIARLQESLLKGSGDFDDLKGDLEVRVGELPVNLSQVADKIDWINRVTHMTFWVNVTVEALEEVRHELRGIMHCRDKPRVIQTLP